MKKKSGFGIILTLLLTGMLTLAFNIQSVKASETIYIRADGSIDPSTAPIQLDGDLYTFTDNIYDSIVVQRSNIIVDGAGYTLQGPGSGWGFHLSGINNVTIKGTNVKGFDWGISLDAGASYNTIFGNNITSNYGGVHLSWSSGNVLKNNNMINNDYNFMVVGYALSHFVQDVDTSNTVDGKPIYYWVSCENIKVPSDAGYVALVNSTNITVKGLRLRNNGQGILLAYTTNAQITNNNLTNNYYGIALLYSSNNNIYSNDITNNSWCGVWLEVSSDNRLYHNNFISNPYHVYFSVGPSINMWDNGYPSGGNFWSDYTGVDANGDGIGDIPYVIDVDNQDRYPLMHPWSPLPVHNMNTGLGYATIQEAINANETLNGHTIFVETGTYYENIVVNKSLTIFGENKDTTIVVGSPGYTAFCIESNNVQISEFTIQGASNGVTSNVQNVAISNNLIINCENSGVQIATTNNTISSNFIANCGTAILIYGSNHTIEQNILMNNNYFVIQLSYFSNNNKVRRNIVINNDATGIYLQSSHNNTISANTFINNEKGIGLAYSTGNAIFHNNIINNTRQVFIDRGNINNIWDDGYPSGGNFWSDYVGVDVKSRSGQDLPGSDGIGDTPYVIDADNVDHYPLMNPYGAPPPPTYSLTIIATIGGTTDPAPGTYSYTANQTVQVTAVSNTGYLFDYWELDDVNIGSANPYTVTMDKNHTSKAVFSLIPPPLSASVSPLSASILVGQSVTFTSTVCGGYTPYAYQWYLNGNPVSGATSNTWTFTPTTSGIYYVYLKVTDDTGNTTQSETAHTTVATVPVGGYSVLIQLPTTAKPVTLHIALLAILTILFTKLKRKTKRKH